MLSIKIKYLKDVIPCEIYTEGDWVDLRCAESMMIKKGEYKAIPLGVAMELPEGYGAIVAPRSSLFGRFGLLCANSFGVIDHSYCGDNDEWHFLVYATKQTFLFKNERICQFRLVELPKKICFQEVQKLGNADRGGIGSTGRM